MRRTVLVAITSTMLVASLSLTTSTTTAGASTTSAGRVGTFLYNFSEFPLDVALEAPRRKAIALNPGDWRYIAQVKAINPNVKMLMYKDLSSTREWDCTNGVDNAFITGGVGYCWANRYHPEWFLTDSAGNRLSYGGYAGTWQMDVGNPAYQAQWLENVRTELTQRGWDGVIMDNALTAADNYHPGVVPARYPTNSSFQSAYVSMLQTAGGGLGSAGFFTIANINDSRMFPGLWDAYTGPLSGGAEEHFVNWNRTFGSGYVWDWGSTGWRDQLSEVLSSAARGKVSHIKTSVASTSGDDPEALRYGLASFLLATNGTSLYGTNSPKWAPEFDWDIGTPLSTYTDLGGSVFRRNFSGGVVVVNASANTPVTVNLGGQYLNANGNLVSSVTVGGTRGVIMRSPSTTSATTPTTITTTTTAVPPTTSTTIAPTTTTTIAVTTSTTTPTSVADTTAPTAPGSLRLSAARRKASLSWTASTDSGSGVANYRIYRTVNGVTTLAGTTSGTSWTNTGLSGGYYVYYVVAVDQAGNVSQASQSVAVRIH